MKKIFYYIILLFFSIHSFAAEEKMVNVYNWPNFIAPKTLESFTRETGIKVNYQIYDSNETLESKLLSGDSGYDVVVPTASPFLARGIQNKLYQPLNKKLLTNYDNLDFVMMEQLASIDQGNGYGVPWMWGTIGIGYNVNLIKSAYPGADMASLDIVFNKEKIAKFKNCGVEMISGKIDLFNTVLAYLELNPNNNKVSDFKKAESILKSVTPYVKSFNTESYINDLSSQKACVVLGYSGDLVQAAAKSKTNSVKYTLPKEGSEIWIDVLAIPKNAPHPNNAHLFINYMMRPEVMAENTNYTKYANGNRASNSFIDKNILDNPVIYPSDKYLKKTFTSPVFDIKLYKMVAKSWNKIRPPA